MRRVLIGLATLLVLILCGVGIVAPRIQKRLLEPPAKWPGGEYQLFEVKEGESARQTAEELAQKGLIRSARAFRSFLVKHGWEAKIKPGLYKVEPGNDAAKIADKLVNRDTWEVKVTIPEGLSLRQIAERIEQAGTAGGQRLLPTAAQIVAAATPERFKKVTGSSLPARVKTAEGYLFPTTYSFPANSSADKIVTHMLQEYFKRFVQAHSEEIRRSSLKPHEIVTLASIVEGEAETDAERPLIAGVFMNRLKRGMRLETDASVQYLLPRHKTRLTHADTRLPSPYNTYLNKGLPPGPICSPGEKSLEAALRPQKTDFLYFVAKGNRTHLFARTYAEHLQNIQLARRG